MPNFAGKLGAQPICQWPKPSRQHLLDVLVRKHPSAFAFLVTVNPCAQSLCWYALVYGTICKNRGGNHNWLLIGTRVCFQCQLDKGNRGKKKRSGDASHFQGTPCEIHRAINLVSRKLLECARVLASLFNASAALSPIAF